MNKIISYQTKGSALLQSIQSKEINLIKTFI